MKAAIRSHPIIRIGNAFSATHSAERAAEDSMDGLMHTLFALEDRKLIRIQNVDGLVCLRAEIAEGGTKAAEFNSRLMSWEDEKAKLKAGKITKEEYDRWRYHYPD